MALVKYGEMIAAMSGSINGTVHSHNRGGAYMRNLSIPTNPQTVFQTAIRNLLTTFSQTWRTLTQVQRTAWNNAVQNYATTNVLGDLRNPSGKDLYTRLNINLFLVGTPAIVTPPAPVGVSSPSSAVLTATAAGGIISIAYTPTPIPAGSDWIFSMHAPVSAGVSFVKNRYRFLATVNTGGASPAVLTAQYAARFGAFAVGQRVGGKIEAVNNVTGEKGTPLSFTTIAV